jgi:hypothetical protein
LAEADRRTLARSLGEVAESVAPQGGAQHPPMFFEDSSDDGAGRTRRHKSHSSTPRKRQVPQSLPGNMTPNDRSRQLVLRPASRRESSPTCTPAPHRRHDGRR